MPYVGVTEKEMAQILSGIVNVAGRSPMAIESARGNVVADWAARKVGSPAQRRLLQTVCRELLAAGADSGFGPFVHTMNDVERSGPFDGHAPA